MVFGVGFGRTGTASLTAALNLLGVRARHFLDYKSLLHQFDSARRVFRVDHVLPMLEGYQAIANGTGLPYRDLDQIFPGSKFILTVRDPDSWLRSKQRYASMEIAEWPLIASATRDAKRFVRDQIYGSFEFDRNTWLKAYQEQVAGVMDYFRDRPADLLVMDIAGGDGWEKLCPFLGLPRPAEPFPIANDFESVAEWHGKLGRMAAQVVEHIPSDARFLLIADNSLWLEQPGAVLFMESGGAYCGPPPDDASAIAELERMRAAGATFAVIAWPSFWWLEYYPGFATRLRSAGPWLVDDDSVKIVNLGPVEDRAVARPSGEQP